jgi:hypothetical protein
LRASEFRPALFPSFTAPDTIAYVVTDFFVHATTENQYL